jgi:uncharacterized coiled-coil DUF342 family protein
MKSQKLAQIEAKIAQLKARAAATRKREAAKERAQKIRAKFAVADFVVTDEFLWAQVLDKATDEQRKIFEVLK